MDRLLGVIISTPKVDRIVLWIFIGWLILLILRQVWILI